MRENTYSYSLTIYMGRFNTDHAHGPMRQLIFYVCKLLYIKNESKTVTK